MTVSQCQKLAVVDVYRQNYRINDGMARYKLVRIDTRQAIKNP